MPQVYHSDNMHIQNMLLVLHGFQQVKNSTYTELRISYQLYEPIYQYRDLQILV